MTYDRGRLGGLGKQRKSSFTSLDVVARRVHHSPPVLSNKPRDCCPMLLQGFDGGFFVLAHETTVALNICA